MPRKERKTEKERMKIMASPGFEPETFSVLDWRDNQLHHETFVLGVCKEIIINLLSPWPTKHINRESDLLGQLATNTFTPTQQWTMVPNLYPKFLFFFILKRSTQNFFSHVLQMLTFS